MKIKERWNVIKLEKAKQLFLYLHLNKILLLRKLKTLRNSYKLPEEQAKEKY